MIIQSRHYCEVKVETISCLAKKKKKKRRTTSLMPKVEGPHVQELYREKITLLRFQFSLGLPLGVWVITTPKQVKWLRYKPEELLALIRIIFILTTPWWWKTFKRVNLSVSESESVEKDEVWMKVNTVQYKSTNLEFRAWATCSSVTFSFSRSIHHCRSTLSQPLWIPKLVRQTPFSAS